MSKEIVGVLDYDRCFEGVEDWLEDLECDCCCLELTDGGLGDNCVLPFPVDPSLPVVVFGFVKL